MGRSQGTTTISSPTLLKEIRSALPSVCLIVILSGDCDAERCVDCASGKVTIGRSKECGLPLAEEDVSRLHAVVERREGDRWFLVDKSRNGTHCNGLAIVGERRLADGDRIRVGRSILVFLCDSDGDVEGGPSSLRRDAVMELWGAFARDADMPFPLAVLRPLVASHPTPPERVCAQLDAIDSALRFFTASLVGVLCQTPERVPRVIAVLQETLDRGVPWERAFHALGGLLSESGPMRAAVAAVHDLDLGGDPLDQALAAADRVRIHVMSQPDLAPSAHGAEERFLGDLLSHLLDALRPLSRYRLLSVAVIAGVDRSMRVRYDLHEHRGACEHFPVASAWIRAPLVHEWCYLRLGEGLPVSLAPFVRYGLCSTCGRRELALAESLVLGPTGAPVGLRSVTTQHRSDAPVPDVEVLDTMYRAFGPSRPSPAAVVRKEAIPLPSPLLPEDLPPREGTPREDRPTPPPEHIPRILFLGASPKGMVDIEPEEDLRAIDNALEHGFRHTKQGIVLLPKLGVHAEDLQNCLNEAVPDVLHVSAHGSVKGEIYLKGDAGRVVSVDPEDLVKILTALKKPPRCVVLCACFSALGASGLLSHVGCVIAAKQAIDARSAIDFCAGFYAAIARGESVSTAFDQGCAEIATLHEGPEQDSKALALMQGTEDPSRMFLADEPGEPDAPGRKTTLDPR